MFVFLSYLKNVIGTQKLVWVIHEWAIGVRATEVILYNTYSNTWKNSFNYLFMCLKYYLMSSK